MARNLLVAIDMPQLQRLTARKTHISGKRSPQLSGELTDLVMQGFALFQQGRLGEAAVVYRHVLRRNPHDFDALHLLLSPKWIRFSTRQRNQIDDVRIACERYDEARCRLKV